jgi:O-antigen ligase
MFLCPHDNWNNTYALAGAVAFLALYLCVCGAHGKKPLSPAKLGLPMMLFAFICFGSLAFSYDFHDSVRILLLLVAAFLLCYIAAASVTDRKSLMTVLGFIYFAVLLTACYALVQRVLGVRVSSSFTDLQANKGVPGRVFATMDNPNNYAELLVMMTPLAAVWAVKVRAKLRTLPLSPFLCCGLALPMLAMVMTYSRSGWISVALAFAILFYYGDKRWIPLLFLACVLAIPFLPNSVVVRLTSMISGEDSSSRFRVYIWQGIFLLLLDHGLTGIGLGPGSFAVVYKEYARSRATIGVPHSHMLWTEMMVETGVLGLITSLWMFLGIVRRNAVGAARSAPGIRRLALCACLGALIGISVTFFVEYVWFYPRDMFAFFIVCGLGIGLLNAPEEAFPENTAPIAAA